MNKARWYNTYDDSFKEDYDMEKKELIKTAEELIAVPWCCPELKEAAGKWIAAFGTENEHEAAEALVNELIEDVVPVDGALAFFAAPEAAEHFGAEEAARMAAHMRELKENGAKYCDCDACAKGAALLEAKDLLLS